MQKQSFHGISYFAHTLSSSGSCSMQNVRDLDNHPGDAKEQHTEKIKEFA
jgi:hypothetical protein